MTRYFEPRTIEAAVRLLAEHGAAARLVAGGTDVMVNLGTGKWDAPAVLVGTKRIEELRGIVIDGAAATVGAATTFGELLFSAELRERLPALPQVAGKIAGPQIRNMATIGGNIGNASPGGDMLNPLLALGARVELARWDGAAVATREVALDRYFTGPGESVRAPEELLTRIRVPLPPPGFRYANEKFGRRPSMECAVLAVGVGAVVDDRGALRDVRVVFGALAPTPFRGGETEAALEGKPLTPEVLEAAMAAARREVKPISDVRGSAEFRRQIAGVLVKRAAQRVVDPERAEPVSLWPALPEGGHVCGRSAEGTAPATAPAGETTVAVSFTLNGQLTTASVAPLTPLIDVIRDHVGLLGTKLGCGEGECGTCTVLLDGVTVNSCLQLAVACDGRDVMTIEALTADGGLDRVQRAFVDHGAVQCGFCTPGMILQAWWLLQQDVELTPELAARVIEGNLCRCTGYVKIVEAILALASDRQEVSTR